jgi:polyisoprenoid-binding protein YceI
VKFAVSPACAVAVVVLTTAYPHSIDARQDRAIGRIQVLDAAVAVRCPLTVGGSFDAKTTALSGELVIDPAREGAIDGSLVVDLRTLETGIGLRDYHMRDRYLEVSKGEGYSSAILSGIHLDGIDPAMPVGKAHFRGSLQLHGQEHEVAGTADIRRTGQDFRVQASFPVKVSDFAITSPSYLGVGVRNDVVVAVNFQAASIRSR